MPRERPSAEAVDDEEAEEGDGDETASGEKRKTMNPSVCGPLKPAPS
jgi:hypothetical protein